jgi:hypothetical protein
VLSCVGSGLATSSSPIQGDLSTVYKIDNFRIHSEWGQAREPNPPRQKKKKKKEEEKEKKKEEEKEGEEKEDEEGSCVGSGLATSSSPIQGDLSTVYKIDNFRIHSEWGQAREPNPPRQKKKKKKKKKKEEEEEEKEKEKKKEEGRRRRRRR